MAYSANTVITDILRDSASLLLVKCLYFGTGTTDEASSLKVNVNTLVGRTMTLTGTLAAPTRPISFIPGELVTAGDGTTGYVCQHWTPNTTHFITQIVLSNSQVQFSNNDVLTGDRSNSVFTIGAAGAAADPAHMSLLSAVWSVCGGAATSVSVEWDNANNTFTDEAIRFSSSGWFSKQNLTESIKSAHRANGATGNIKVSTYGVGAKGGYSLILEFRKEHGFAQRPIY